jgi:predicted dienelactone hydrolase
MNQSPNSKPEGFMLQEGEPLTTDLTLAAEVRLYYDVYAPGGGPAPLLLALHGYGSNKGWMMREAREHAPEGFAVAALQGAHQHM